MIGRKIYHVAVSEKVADSYAYMKTKSEDVTLSLESGTIERETEYFYFVKHDAPTSSNHGWWANGKMKKDNASFSPQEAVDQITKAYSFHTNQWEKEIEANQSRLKLVNEVNQKLIAFRSVL